MAVLGSICNMGRQHLILLILLAVLDSVSGQTIGTANPRNFLIPPQQCHHEDRCGAKPGSDRQWTYTLGIPKNCYNNEHWTSQCSKNKRCGKRDIEDDRYSERHGSGTADHVQSINTDKTINDDGGTHKPDKSNPAILEAEGANSKLWPNAARPMVYPSCGSQDNAQDLLYATCKLTRLHNKSSSGLVSALHAQKVLDDSPIHDRNLKYSGSAHSVRMLRAAADDDLGDMSRICASKLGGSSQEQGQTFSSWSSAFSSDQLIVAGGLPDPGLSKSNDATIDQHTDSRSRAPTSIEALDIVLPASPNGVHADGTATTKQSSASSLGTPRSSGAIFSWHTEKQLGRRDVAGSSAILTDPFSLHGAPIRLKWAPSPGHVLESSLPYIPSSSPRKKASQSHPGKHPPADLEAKFSILESSQMPEPAHPMPAISREPRNQARLRKASEKRLDSLKPRIVITKQHYIRNKNQNQASTASGKRPKSRMGVKGQTSSSTSLETPHDIIATQHESFTGPSTPATSHGSVGTEADENIFFFPHWLDPPAFVPSQPSPSQDSTHSPRPIKHSKSIMRTYPLVDRDILNLPETGEPSLARAVSVEHNASCLKSPGLLDPQPTNRFPGFSCIQQRGLVVDHQTRDRLYDAISTSANRAMLQRDASRTRNPSLHKRHEPENSQDQASKSSKSSKSRVAGVPKQSQNSEAVLFRPPYILESSSSRNSRSSRPGDSASKDSQTLTAKGLEISGYKSTSHPEPKSSRVEKSRPDLTHMLGSGSLQATPPILESSLTPPSYPSKLDTATNKAAHGVANTILAAEAYPGHSQAPVGVIFIPSQINFIHAKYAAMNRVFGTPTSQASIPKIEPKFKYHPMPDMNSESIQTFTGNPSPHHPNAPLTMTSLGVGATNPPSPNHILEGKHHLPSHPQQRPLGSASVSHLSPLRLHPADPNPIRPTPIRPAAIQPSSSRPNPFRPLSNQIIPIRGKNSKSFRPYNGLPRLEPESDTDTTASSQGSSESVNPSFAPKDHTSAQIGSPRPGQGGKHLGSSPARHPASPSSSNHRRDTQTTTKYKRPAINGWYRDDYDGAAGVRLSPRSWSTGNPKPKSDDIFDSLDDLISLPSLGKATLGESSLTPPSSAPHSSAPHSAPPHSAPPSKKIVHKSFQPKSAKHILTPSNLLSSSLTAPRVARHRVGSSDVSSSSLSPFDWSPPDWSPPDWSPSISPPSLSTSAESPRSKLPKSKLSQLKPSQPKLSQHKPSQRKPSQLKPSQLKPSQLKPQDSKPSLPRLASHHVAPFSLSLPSAFYSSPVLPKVAAPRTSLSDLVLPKVASFDSARANAVLPKAFSPVTASPQTATRRSSRSKPAIYRAESSKQLSKMPQQSKGAMIEAEATTDPDAPVFGPYKRVGRPSGSKDTFKRVKTQSRIRDMGRS